MMNTGIQTLEVLKARKKLREFLPVLPQDESGEYEFSYPALEGFLYGIHLSPFEITADSWGYYLDQHISDACYESDHYREYILNLYEDIKISLENKLYFKTHTLSIPSSLPEGNVDQHPLKHWVMGLTMSMKLMHSEINALPKKVRKSKSFKKTIEDFQTIVSKLINVLSLRMEMYQLVSRVEDQVELAKRDLGLPLDKSFLRILETLHHASDHAIHRLNAIR
jgi:hypothetical protein